MRYLKPEFQKINGGRPPLTANFAPPPSEQPETKGGFHASNGMAVARKIKYELQTAEIRKG